MPGYCFGGRAATRERRSREGFSRAAKSRGKVGLVLILLAAPRSIYLTGLPHTAFNVLIPPATQAAITALDFIIVLALSYRQQTLWNLFYLSFDWQLNLKSSDKRLDLHFLQFFKSSLIIVLGHTQTDFATFFSP